MSESVTKTKRAKKKGETSESQVDSHISEDVKTEGGLSVQKTGVKMIGKSGVRSSIGGTRKSNSINTKEENTFETEVNESGGENISGAKISKKVNSQSSTSKSSRSSSASKSTRSSKSSKDSGDLASVQNNSVSHGVSEAAEALNSKLSSSTSKISHSQPLEKAVEESAEINPANQPQKSSPTQQMAAPPEDKNIIMKPPIIVKDLAARLGCKPFQLIHELMEFNIFATLNQAIEEEHARKICEKRGFTFNVERRGEKTIASVAQPVEQKQVEQKQQTLESKPKETLPAEVKSEVKTRPPVVTFMGHVDHGKTSLLDAIRQARVAAGEAGGITQHIGAYTVTHKGQSITFLDTPGHEAFTAMRARGANVTDIAVIVCAADDGVMPQTIEAIQHAKAAKVAIMVAINKIDAPGAKPDRVRQQMQDYGLMAEEWGGQTIFCEVSATKKIGIDKLIEMILLQAEILELKGETKGPAVGSIIESQIEQGRGPTATVLVRRGTLRLGDSFVCGEHMGKVKALIDDRGQAIKEAGPSKPAKVISFSGTPHPGEEFKVVANEKEARQITEERVQASRLGKLSLAASGSGGAPVTLENLFASLKEGQKKTLRLVLKTDVQGSLEAIVDSLKKIKSQKIDIDFVLTGVGPISVNDVLLARASNAVILGFNTKTDHAAAAAAKREDVQIKLFSIIYELIDQVREAMVGMLDPETRETQIGTALVKKVFELSKFPVAGCMVQNGRISKSGRARVMRKKQPIYDGAIVTLKRFQDETSEVRAGLECGVRLGNFNEYLPDDIIECYILEKVPQSL